jgi:hypothetical protein
MTKKNYDIHCHLLDLSHPNFLALLSRDGLVTESSVKNVIQNLPWYLKILPPGLLSLFKSAVVKNIKNYLKNDAGTYRNLLSVMESPIEYSLLYVDYFLRNKQPIFDIKTSGYSKIILCPLIVDFGYKKSKGTSFYDLPPSKPVANQTLDILNAIYFYYNYEMIPHDSKINRLDVRPKPRDVDKELFEVYPFLGINTQNYDYQSIQSLFNRYFSGYESDSILERKAKLYQNLGTVKVHLDDFINSENDNKFSYLFAGIKLYPPLGFDPWPGNNSEELNKVKLLYSECIRRRLPITVHCSDGGYIADDNSVEFTNPAGKWSKVLSNPDYKDLRINFAHLGSQHNGKTDWQATILNYISYGINKNIYTDISCVTFRPEDYVPLKNIIANPENEQKILFGSDFVINLLWSETSSYNDYLNNLLIKTNPLNDAQKDIICSQNPEKFLFF